MTVLTYLWETQTNDFNKTQKAVIGSTLSFIFTIAICAFILLALDITK